MNIRRIALAVAALSMVAVSHAEARSSFGGGRSFSRPSFSSRSYSAPRSYSSPKLYSAPKTAIPKTTYRPTYNTTIVQQQSGGGFFSSMFGSIAGMGIYHWLFEDDDKTPETVPVPTPRPTEVPASN